MFTDDLDENVTDIDMSLVTGDDMMGMDASQECEESQFGDPDDACHGEASHGMVDLRDAAPREEPVKRRPREWHEEPVSLRMLMTEKVGSADAEASKADVSSTRTSAYALKEMMLWHPNQLIAIFSDEVLSDMGDATPARRLKCKSNVSSLYVKYATKSREHGAPPELVKRRYARGKDCFTKVLSKYSGVRWKECRHAARTYYSVPEMTRRHRNFWELVSVAVDWHKPLRDVLGYAQGQPSIKDSPATQAVAPVKEVALEDMVFENVVGVSVTYNTRIGMRDALVLRLLQDKATDEQFVAALKASEFHERHFKQFQDFIEALVADFKMSSYAVSMEFSPGAKERGRVHLHAWLGAGVRGGPGNSGGKKQFDIPVRELYYQKLEPWTKPTRPPKWHPVTVFNACVNGLYYVSCEKPGSIFRYTNVVPIEVSM